MSAEDSQDWALERQPSVVGKQKQEDHCKFEASLDSIDFQAA